MRSNCEILELGKEMACDTLVPYYDMGISCGLPNEMGDIPPELMAVPGVLTMGLNVTFVRAMGDSMIGVNIHDGDLLMVESTSRFRNQDIVAVKVDGEELLKSYYMDECGRHWLGPCRVLMDCGYIPRSRYDLFCDLVFSVLPDHEHLPHEDELRRMAVDCFSKPFKTWSDERAPVHGHHYLGYYNAGVAMLQQLPENSQKLP